MYTYFHYVVFEITCQGRMGGCDTLLKSSTPVVKTLLRVCHLSLSSRCVHDLIAGGRSVTAHNYVKHALHCLMHSRRFFASRCSWHFFCSTACQILLAETMHPIKTECRKSELGSPYVRLYGQS